MNPHITPNFIQSKSITHESDLDGHISLSLRHLSAEYLIFQDPAMVREFLFPCYLTWIPEIKKSNPFTVIEMDSDGYIGELIPLWIEAGFNCCSPAEVAASNDIVEYRRIYGKKIGYRGGIDKRTIAGGGKTVKEEVLRVVPPLLREGGFIPSCDHGVPPDISWQNYVDYSRLLAKLTGWL